MPLHLLSATLSCLLESSAYFEDLASGMVGRKPIDRVSGMAALYIAAAASQGTA